ncbi:FUSC family membrane protein [Mariniflexile ostreae]|uniref:FUSC family membrane protein n=1 Tax=Mariniflexile ostreae TaxID=1520892 RepID=A0ABV5FFR6_9FLAO
MKSTNFSKAILIVVSVTIPVVIGVSLGHFEIGLAICFGAFWCSPSDISGSNKHKNLGILFSAAMVMVVSFIGGYLKFSIWILLPVLGLLTFAIASISVYGFRASLISFSGLLALVLSFANDSDTLEVYQRAILIGIGGIWYLSLSTLWYYINPKAQTEEVLNKIFLLTAEFIETRAKLIESQKERQNLLVKLLEQQHELTEHHETMRDIFMVSRKNSGKSNYQGKRLLVFVQLIDLLETAIANPVNYNKLDTLLCKHPKFIQSFQDLMFEMASQLTLIAKYSNTPKKLPRNNSLTHAFNTIKQDIEHFKQTMGQEDYEGYLMLQNLLDYQEKQIGKLKEIKWLLGNPKLDTDDFIEKDVLKRFVVLPDYDPKIWIRNFSFRSTIFRHSLRLAVTVMIGYVIGKVFDFQNPYWILLTIIVIMRPSYGLTKKRSKDRIIGTLIGALLATGLVFLIQNPYLYAILGIASLVVTFSMVQKNYKASAIFITLSVVFIYAIIEPDVLTVIQFRVLDTIIGAVLSFMAILWLWPAWGIMEIGENIRDSIKANCHFFKHISTFYQEKGKVSTAYKVSRKEAFLQVSNLSAAFQRMAQEPQSKQKQLDDVYELVVLNHTFLSALASLSIYIQNQPTSEASDTFVLMCDDVNTNLNQILNILETKPSANIKQRDLSKSHLNRQRFSETSNKIKELTISETKNQRDHQEAHLIWEQLNWLYSLSEKIFKRVSLLKI